MSATPTPVTVATSADGPRLLAVWESAVRATHHFLTEADIQALISVVREVLATFAPIHCLRAADGVPYAFMGVAEGKIEMLFVDAAFRGRGAGKALVQFAIAKLGATAVDVNEQNPAAVGFYQHLGFQVGRRSPLDSQGRPFPILQLSLQQT